MSVLSRHKKIKMITIIAASLTVAILVSLTCIGFFYGNSRERLDCCAYHPDFYTRDLYRINDQVYVSMIMNPKTGYLTDNVPSYYGKISDSVKNIKFSNDDQANVTAGKIDASFYASRDQNQNVYRIRTQDGILQTDDVLLTASGTHIAKIITPYSKNMLDDWDAYAADLDIAIDTKIWRDTPRSECVDINLHKLKNSPYYQVDTTNQYFNLHLFKKRLSFFFADVKNLF